jgi:hypothetical protein
MAPTPRLGKCRSRHRDEAATASPSRTLCPERTDEPSSNMVNGVLTPLNIMTIQKDNIGVLLMQINTLWNVRR